MPSPGASSPPTGDPTPPILQQVGTVFVKHRGRRFLYFGGCDYFRLSRHPRVLQAIRHCLAACGVNVGASRATTGDHAVYARLERALASFFQVEQAVCVPAGYASNAAAVQALRDRIDWVAMDERAHPSLRDAAAILRKPVTTFRHRDPRHLASKLHARPHHRALVMTDGLCARDGTIAPLAEYQPWLREDDWLLVDDAHGVGVLGKHGRGSPEHCGLRPPQLIQTCTLSKAFGVYGGAILTTHAIARIISTQSPQFVGSTPLPLPIAAGALAAVTVVRTTPALRRRLLANIRRVKTRLRAHGLEIPDTPAPIISVETQSPEAGRELQGALRRAGIFPSLIRYPGGPAGSYFRFAISSEHRPEHLDRLVRVLLAAPGLRAVA